MAKRLGITVSVTDARKHVTLTANAGVRDAIGRARGERGARRVVRVRELHRVRNGNVIAGAINRGVCAGHAVNLDEGA